MATKNDNSTILTVGLLAIGGFIAWRLFGGGTKKVQAASSPDVGGTYGGSQYPDDYYPPYYGDTGQQSLWQQILQALLGGKSGGGGISMGKGSGSSSDSGSGRNSSGSSGSGNTDIFNSILEGLWGNGNLQGGESNSDFGGDSLFTYDPGASDEELAGYQIPYEDSGELLNLPSYYPSPDPIETSGDETQYQIDPSSYGGGDDLGGGYDYGGGGGGGGGADISGGSDDAGSGDDSD